MAGSQPVYIVFNPRSGKGRGERLVQPVLEAFKTLGIEVDYARTARAGDEASLTEAALARGFRKIVAVGGDGTWSNVGNAIVRAGEGAQLGLVSGGTGCDLAKSLGIPPKDIAACARIVAEGKSRAIDVGRLEDRFFLNVAGFGFDIAVIEDSWTVRYLGGDLLYLYCALRQLFAFPGFPVEIEVDGRVWGRRELLMLIFANGRIFGGGFRIAPQADLSDGRFEMMAFRNMGLLKRLGLLVRLLRGRHQGAPEVESVVSSSFTLRFETPPAYEIDGEWIRARSRELRIESVPRALEVLVPT